MAPKGGKRRCHQGRKFDRGGNVKADGGKDTRASRLKQKRESPLSKPMVGHDHAKTVLGPRAWTRTVTEESQAWKNPATAKGLHLQLNKDLRSPLSETEIARKRGKTFCQGEEAKGMQDTIGEGRVETLGCAQPCSGVPSKTTEKSKFRYKGTREQKE